MSRNPRHALSGAVLAGVAAVGISIAGAVSLIAIAGASPRPIAPAKSAALPRVLTCAGAPVLKPGKISLTCGRYATTLSHLRWQKWTSSAAKGTGTLNTVTCSTRCASRRTTSVAATVYLDDPIPAARGYAFYLTDVRYGSARAQKSEVWINHKLYVAKKKKS